MTLDPADSLPEVIYEGFHKQDNTVTLCYVCGNLVGEVELEKGEDYIFDMSEGLLNNLGLSLTDSDRIIWY